VSDNVLPFPGYTIDRARQEVTAAFADVRAGRTELWAAQASVLGALDALEIQQQRMREAHNATVAATGEGKVAKNPRATSARAASNIAPKVGTQRAEVLSYIVERGGATDFEIARAIRMLPNSVRPRRGELVEGGYVRLTDRTRRHRGSDFAVWEATADGVAWHNANINGAAAA
jgi:hypothetical protein